MTEAGPVRPAALTDRAVSDWEHEIRARLGSGDDAVLGEIYDQYSSFVYGLALRVIGDARAAEDISQDVFLFIWERPEAFDPDRGSLRTWLGTLTHRRSVDYVRREEARRRRTQRDASLRATQIPDVEEMATALVTAERVRSALDVLPEEQRRAIQLAYFGGKTYRQVAEVLGIPEGTAKSRLRLGLRRIADALGGEGLEQWA
jgi:RNA polymerase sigma factor (sigma-70 family)